MRADRTITFRFNAPNAKEVILIGELDGKTHPMTRDERGVWSVTVGPWPPDVYNYQFRVDGTIAMDPQNPNVKLGWGGFPPANMVEVPGSGLEFDDARTVAETQRMLGTRPALLATCAQGYFEKCASRSRIVPTAPWATAARSLAEVFEWYARGLTGSFFGAPIRITAILPRTSTPW